MSHMEYPSVSHMEYPFVNIFINSCRNTSIVYALFVVNDLVLYNVSSYVAPCVTFVERKHIFVFSMVSLRTKMCFHWHSLSYSDPHCLHRWLSDLMPLFVVLALASSCSCHITGILSQIQNEECMRAYLCI